MKFLYQFSAGDSFFHRLDPRSKLVFVVCYMVAAFFFPYPWWMFVAVIVLIRVLAGISIKDYWMFVAYMAPLMIVLTFVQMLVGPPPPIEIFGVVIPFLSLPGWNIGIRIAFRLAVTGMTFIMFSMTTDPFDLGMALYHTGLPYRVAYMIAFALRFFPLLQEELFVIRSALQARAYAAIGSINPITLVRGLGVSVIPLGVGALKRSQDIALAMERRGLGFPDQLGIKRVIFRDVRLRTWDYVVIVISVLGLIATITIFSSDLGKIWAPLP
ncbi:MAG: energy-coupling factor transporter transmembrane protein EcfT [Anaerolineales bacterium]|nr:energy-coupling factor transporter transmembrane protein EcfT [Anaerolineales bacterium]MCK5315554.1 energy-coupling factor transporter transmembrane protein EcfT [Anaerolineales bacterium]